MQLEEEEKTRAPLPLYLYLYTFDPYLYLDNLGVAEKKEI